MYYSRYLLPPPPPPTLKAKEAGWRCTKKSNNIRFTENLLFFHLPFNFAPGDNGAAWVFPSSRDFLKKKSFFLREKYEGRPQVWGCFLVLSFFFCQKEKKKGALLPFSSTDGIIRGIWCWSPPPAWFPWKKAADRHVGTEERGRERESPAAAAPLRSVVTAKDFVFLGKETVLSLLPSFHVFPRKWIKKEEKME